MADHDLSKIIDANGDSWNIKAKGLESQISIGGKAGGDVTGTTTSDLTGDTTFTLTIGNGKVTTSKIDDSAVTTGKIADSAVTIDKIAASAKSGAVSDNDGNLATHAQVKTAIDTAIAGQGAYRGKQTVEVINTWTSSNLNNGDRCITEDAGTITLGNFAVRAGEDLIFWKSGDTAVWQTMDGEFKLKQTAKSDPTASGTTLTAIASITQDANGDITATKKTIQDATTGQKGVVQLSSSSSSTDESNAATPKGVWAAINTLDVTDSAVTNQFVTVVSETNGKISVTRAQPTISNVSGLQTALNGKEGTFTINYDSTNNALVFSKTFGTV